MGTPHADPRPSTPAAPPPAPAVFPGPEGHLTVGLYTGRIGRVDLGACARRLGWGRLRERLASKRWRYVGVFGPEVFLGVAVVRTGYLASSFAYAYRRPGGPLVDREDFAPPLWVRAESDRGLGESRAALWGLRVRASAHRDQDGSTRVRLRAPDLRAEIEVAAAAAPLALVSGVRPAGINVTHKAAGLPARGWVQVRGERLDLGEAWAVLDDTSGLLARDTRWRWAAAAGPGWGLNLVEGFNDLDQTENAVWREGSLVPVGRATFEFDRSQPLDPWRVRTDDGAVDLTFAPEGMRRGDVRLGFLESVYRAPFGCFAGRLLGEEVVGLPGLTEDHMARW